MRVYEVDMHKEKEKAMTSIVSSIVGRLRKRWRKMSSLVQC